MAALKRDWVGGRVRSHAELDEIDRKFWADAELSARFDASIELSLVAWSLRYPNEPPPPIGSSSTNPEAVTVERARDVVAP